MSRALGDFSYKGNPNLSILEQIISPAPDISTTSRQEISNLIIGCDGIWEAKTNEDMAKWFQRAMQGKNATLRSII
jgi:serine/threonine protein phosphatase PrpC